MTAQARSRAQYVVSHLIFTNAGMYCRVATGFSTVVSCSDFTGFFSDYFQRKVGSFQTKAIMSHTTPNNQRNHVVDFLHMRVGLNIVVIV